MRDDISSKKNDLLTPQEHEIIGSTLPFVPEDFHTPLRILDGDDINQVDLQRQTEKYFESGFVSALLGFPGKTLAFSMEELDLRTGRTLRDPRVLGLLNKETREIEEVSGRDLTKELFNMFKDSGIDLHLREERRGIENRGNSGENIA